MKEISVNEFMRSLTVGQRDTFAASFTGIVTTFISYIPVNLFGAWTSNWMHWKTNAIFVVVFTVFSWMAIRFKFGYAGLVVPLVASLLVFVPLGLQGQRPFWAETWMIWTYFGTATIVMSVLSMYFHKLSRTES